MAKLCPHGVLARSGTIPRKCKDCMNAYKLRWRWAQRKRQMALCPEDRLKSFNRTTSDTLGRLKEWKAKRAEPKVVSAKRYRVKLKNDVLTAYGGCCECCGESNFGFLSIDHPNGDGAQWRRERNMLGSFQTYQWLRKNGYPPGFRILCMNCNVGRHWNGGVCPHVEERLQYASARVS